MSRFGGDGDEDFGGQWWLWEKASFRCFNGRPGQQILRDLHAALLALPEKKLIRTRLADETGCVCALGALAVARGKSIDELAKKIPDDPWDSEWEAEQETLEVAMQLGVKTTMAVAISYANDDDLSFGETDEQRYERMLQWIEKRLIPARSVSVCPPADGAS